MQKNRSSVSGTELGSAEGFCAAKDPEIKVAFRKIMGIFAA
jgi:hypothetical protein